MQPTRSLRPLYITAAIIGALVLIWWLSLILLQNRFVQAQAWSACYNVTSSAGFCLAAFPLPE